MKKTLIYHLYVCDDIETNVCYNIHKECLKIYSNVFDNVKFIISMDDLTDKILKQKAMDFINDIGYSCETDISIRQNTCLCEVDTLNREVLDFDNKNEEYIFFCHSKGVTNFRDNIYNGHNLYSIYKWITVMYFYNLNFIEELEKHFIGKQCVSEVMYGTLLLVSDNIHRALSTSNLHFSGTFYWFNKQFYKNLVLSNRLFNFKAVNRQDAEMMPGYLFDYFGYGRGIKTHNDVSFILEDFDGKFYSASEDEWDYIINALGDKESFNKFFNNINEKINFNI